jgi:hypothetical protein
MTSATKPPKVYSMIMPSPSVTSWQVKCRDDESDNGDTYEKKIEHGEPPAIGAGRNRRVLKKL